MSDRTFKVGHEAMHGEDIRAWQETIKKLFRTMDINCPIKIDGVYGVGTRSYTASLCRALGLISAEQAMMNGVTPALRRKLRNVQLSTAEQSVRVSKERRDYRQALRARWHVRVHRPVVRIITDDWGFHPGIHDGVDVICPDDAVLYAMIHSKVIDVRSSGWWGLGAPKNPKLKAKGDGIIQLEVLESVGPFHKGDHIGYGHAEKAYVREGQTVNSGQPIGHAGLANVSHIHLMLNNGKTDKGIGNKDPRPCLDYAVKHSR